MASVKKRERGGQTRYVARWRDPDGKQRSKSFVKKGDADRFAATVEADKLRGTYLDPKAGMETVRVYASQWLAQQQIDESTRAHVEMWFRLHVFPKLGDQQLRQVRTSTIRAWLQSLSDLAPNYRRSIYSYAAAVFAAAVDDDQIARSPFRAPSIQAPRGEQRRVVPWPYEWVFGMQDELPADYAATVTLAAGLGLRQGEVFGLDPADVDWLRGEVLVRRQVKQIRHRMVFAPPKGGKERVVPLSGKVRDELAAFLAEHPARPVSLPWKSVDGSEITARLFVTNREGRAVNRNTFNEWIWRPALTRAGIPHGPRNGMHALRHWWASVLLDQGVSIRAVSEYLGHHDPGFTLRTYTHLMPQSDDRARSALDDALGTHSAHNPSGFAGTPSDAFGPVSAGESG